MHKIIASALGTGYAPIAPGTAGAILGIIIMYFLNLMLISLKINTNTILFLDLVAIILVLFIGVHAITKVHQSWKHDASEIVIDEVIGVWIAVLAMPFHWKYYLYALILFRFFDIAKPLYIRRFDEMKTDWSVMLDDVLAGVYSLIAIQILYFFNWI